MRMVALIPARAGSKRIPGKNFKTFAGAPLYLHSLIAATESGVFDQVFLCTDTLVLPPRSLHVQVLLRDPVPDDQPDITWVRQVISHVDCDAFAILRPTSPFRSAETIRRAYREFCAQKDADSIRAVRPVTEHPHKMWILREQGEMIPFASTGLPKKDIPLHSRPTQTLQPVYVQTSSLEMAHVHCITRFGSIAGRTIYPFVVEGPDALALDTPADWAYATYLVETGQATLPTLGVGPQMPAA